MSVTDLEEQVLATVNALSHGADLYFLAEERVPGFKDNFVSRFDQ